MSRTTGGTVDGTDGLEAGDGRSASAGIPAGRVRRRVHGGDGTEAVGSARVLSLPQGAIRCLYTAQVGGYGVDWNGGVARKDKIKGE